MLCFFICTDESPRHAERAGAKRRAAAGGGERHAAEVKKQGAMRSAPSEQCDYVSEVHFKSFCPCHISTIVMIPLVLQLSCFSYV